jgi:hypothetical protein
VRAYLAHRRALGERGRPRNEQSSEVAVLRI